MDKQIFTLADPMSLKTPDLDEIAKIAPGWLHLNNCSDFSFLYMSPQMQKEVGINFADDPIEIDCLFWNMVHPSTIGNVLNSWGELSDRSLKTFCSTAFIQIKLPDKKFEWFISNSKYYAKQNCIISTTNSLKTLKDFKYSLGKALDTTYFLKKNILKYDLLTKREKEVVRLIVQGKTMGEVSKNLFISKLTAETHRKNIYQKLKIINLCELIHFAYVYGIIK